MRGFGGPKSTKNRTKIDPKSIQKEDAILNATWKALGPIFDGFWLQNGGVGGSGGPKNQEKSILGGVLGGLGGILGPKSQKRSADPRSDRPIWHPKWRPKSIRIAPKSDPKGDHFYDRFEDRFLERFGTNLIRS